MEGRGYKPGGALLSPLGFGHKPRGEGRPQSFHPSVLATNREVMEGRGYKPGGALLSPLGFGHKPRGEGRPQSFHPSVLATNRVAKEDRAPFHSSVLTSNRRKAALLSLSWFGHKPRGQGRPRSFHPSLLPTNRVMKERRAPSTPLFWLQTKW